MNNGVSCLSLLKVVFMPGRFGYELHMIEGPRPKSIESNFERVGISLKKMAVESDDPAVILENLQARLKHEDDEDADPDFH
ncbi:hypothetical protein L6270_04975 [Candidatus Parcubacteria bacterium]|nr:hypothetical protein [Patescibacteria group bacterium]MBU4309314.1 hypothetical protein [Patescibacteria group bacterium]MBU4432291.1 hypothetical protein [Patescibacteria group bacterium]MBU4577675.1 hypothetical protein [Patescibacteria group bacterium]MCG2697361.1 hypothetical protein [Candidatus Parcubacteria bacterium]